MTEREKYLNALISAQASGQRVSTEISEVLDAWRNEVIHSQESPKQKAIRYAHENKKAVLSSFSLRDIYSELSDRGFFQDVCDELGIYEEKYFEYMRKKGVY